MRTNQCARAIRLASTISLALAFGCRPDSGERAIPKIVATDAGAQSQADSGSDEDLFFRDAMTRQTVFLDSGTLVGGGIRVSALNTDRVDLLFVIDNSISMADKQELFKQAVPDLLRRLANPICLDPATGDTSQPASADATCPAGMHRQFNPVKDMHVGVISSSLGGFGSTVCASGESEDDRGHLVGSLARADGISTYEQLGFLAWDPNQQAEPVGTDELPSLVSGFESIVDAVGEVGCGFESSLEAWYRFLADPKPFATIELEPCASNASSSCATPTGEDSVVLAQRAAFLRPDSTLLLMMLTDEDDCSMVPSQQLYYAARSDIVLPPGSSACESDSNDPCCYSCAVTPPDACPEDPACATPWDHDDPLNLRCHRQKERFGIDFLYPIDRYLAALTEPELVDYEGNTSPNPLFSDLSGSGGPIRGRGNVFLVGIVGVPWQDVATTDSLDTVGSLELKTAEQLERDGTWDVILGDPAQGVPPTDPLMIPSVAPRTGTNPITGDALVGPDGEYLANRINGHEWNNFNGDDLQFSCIFALPEPRDCALVDRDVGCDCKNLQPGDNSPLCQAPDGSYDTVQRFAKAYPPPRILSLLKRFGDNSVVASICPKNVTDSTREDFGYRPVLGSILRDVAPQLIE